MDVVSKDETAAPAASQESLAVLAVSDINQVIALIERGVQSLETRFTTRALRNTGPIRKRLSPQVLTQIVALYLPVDSPTLAVVSAALPAVAVAPTKNTGVATSGKKVTATTATATTAVTDTTARPTRQIPEVEVFVAYLVLLHLHDTRAFEKGHALSIYLVETIQRVNSRTLDQIASRVYFFYARFLELLGKAADARPTLLVAQRIATLRHDVDTLSTVINLLARNYLLYNLYEQADKFISKAKFPLTEASNNQVARYMYHVGRIQAIQLNYTSAHTHLLQAIRKAPQTTASVGFQQSVHKLTIIVEMLMGETPDRAVFRQPTLRKSLLPYLAITQAVRVGDLAKFQEALSTYEKLFKQDKTYTLIRRLRHNVIKTGIKKISLSYARISLKDICLKLQLDSEEDVEYIVARAIRDGVIDATLNHAEGYMKSTENANVYTTTEPQQAFDRRINFCLELHKDSVKALRFPLKSKNKDLEHASELKDEERKLATGIKGGLEEEDDEMDF